jgi:hypothetical protein
MGSKKEKKKKKNIISKGWGRDGGQGGSDGDSRRRRRRIKGFEKEDELRPNKTDGQTSFRYVFRCIVSSVERGG